MEELVALFMVLWDKITKTRYYELRISNFEF